MFSSVVGESVLYYICAYFCLGNFVTIDNGEGDFGEWILWALIKI